MKDGAALRIGILKNQPQTSGEELILGSGG